METQVASLNRPTLLKRIDHLKKIKKNNPINNTQINNYEQSINKIINILLKSILPTHIKNLAKQKKIQITSKVTANTKLKTFFLYLYINKKLIPNIISRKLFTSNKELLNYFTTQTINISTHYTHFIKP